MLKSKTRVNIPDKLSNEFFEKRCCVEVLEIRKKLVYLDCSFYGILAKA